MLQKLFKRGSLAVATDSVGITFESLQDTSYLGDGAYVGHDGFQIWLVTHDGYSTTNAVAVDFVAADDLVNYIKHLKEKGRA